MTLLLVAVAAFVASVVNSMAGGGTFLTFPALVGVAGLTDKAANITSSLGLWPGSASSVVATRRELRRLPRPMLVGYGLISLAGGAAGAVLLQFYTTQATFRLVIPWLLAFATAVFAFGKPIARWAGRRHGERSVGWTIVVGLIQCVVAVYGGYFGAGIGVLMLAGLSFAGLDDIHHMNALKVVLATLINAAASVVFLVGRAGAPPGEGVHWPLAVVMAGAAAVGGFVGMVAARRVKPDHLRAVILAIGVGLTTYYFVHNYGLLKRA